MRQVHGLDVSPPSGPTHPANDDIEQFLATDHIDRLRNELYEIHIEIANERQNSNTCHRNAGGSTKEFLGVLDTQLKDDSISRLAVNR